MPVESTMGPDDAIAIVGIGGLFPAPIRSSSSGPMFANGVDATSDVPARRWLIDPAQAFDPRIALPDHVYSIRGGFVDRPRLDPDGLDLDRIAPRAARPALSSRASRGASRRGDDADDRRSSGAASA